MNQASVEVGRDFIAHYGVKGMKWGVRRSNMPSPITATTVVNKGLGKKTKIKVKGGQAHPATDDAIKVALHKQKLRKSGPAALSNKELQEVITRSNLEQQARAATASGGKKFVAKLVKDEGQRQIQREVSSQADAAIRRRKAA